MKKAKRSTKKAPKRSASKAGGAAPDAAAQLGRILSLIPRIADGEEHSLDRIAKMLDVDAPTVVRDLQSIANRFDEPGGFVEGLQILIESTRVSVHTNHFRRPMRLTVPELHAVDLGLAMLQTESPPDERRPIEGARERIRKLASALDDTKIPERGYEAAAPSARELPSIRQG